MADTTGWRDRMRDALRLVKAGELRGATRAIQDAIAGRMRRAEPQGPPASTPATHCVSLALPELAAPIGLSDDTQEATTASGESALADPDSVGESARHEPAPAFVEPPSPADARQGSETVPEHVLPFARLPGMARAPTSRMRRRHLPLPATAPLRYRLFAPAEVDGPRPLLVMLHGCKQDAEDFARGTRAAQHANAMGWYVLFPEQHAHANVARCWNWFRPQDQIGDSGEPRALLDVIDEVAAMHAIDESRVYVAGLSAGAAMAVILAARHPDRFAAVAAHSGLPFAAAQNVPNAFSAMRTRGNSAALPAGSFVPLLTLHGDADRTVAPANADALVAQWHAALPTPVEHGVAQERVAGREVRCERWTGPDGRVQI
jgi:poly(hydroxyalkanoate) depolymerase family esterase